jgi:hypothetical protein
MGDTYDVEIPDLQREQYLLIISEATRIPPLLSSFLGNENFMRSDKLNYASQ